jgi:hypothetical protein
LATASDPIKVFSVHQRVRKGTNAITVRLTPAGRAYLLNDPNPHVKVTVSITPTSGSRQTLTQTIAPPVSSKFSSIQFTGTPANPTIALKGRALAPLPAPNPSGSPAGHNGCPSKPGNYGSDYSLQFALIDETGRWSAGNSTATNTSCIGLIPTKVSPGEVDYRFGSFYTSLYPQFKLNTGDEVELVLNGAAADVHVAYGAPITP